MNQDSIELAHLLRQGASMVRELKSLRRIDSMFAERLATDYEEALSELMPPPMMTVKTPATTPAKPPRTMAECMDLAISIVERDRPSPDEEILCRCSAYSSRHVLGEGDCCGCETSPDCEHWTRVPDYYGTGDRDNVRYERTEK